MPVRRLRTAAKNAGVVEGGSSGSRAMCAISARQLGAVRRTTQQAAEHPLVDEPQLVAVVEREDAPAGAARRRRRGPDENWPLMPRWPRTASP